MTILKELDGGNADLLRRQPGHARLRRNWRRGSAAGDRLLVVPETGDLLHVPAAGTQVAAEAVGRAFTAFQQMGEVPDAQISRFFEEFAARLEADEAWEPIAAANEEDVRRAKAKGRSTTRLAASDKMRRDMVAGLRAWRDAPTRRGQVVERVVHDGWAVEQVADALGVIGFVFEGRPNVFADATGVLRGGNTVVFRIGADALGTARAIVHTPSHPHWRRRACRRGRRHWWTARSGRRAGRCSRTRACRWPSRAGPARPWSSSAASPAMPASRSACTAPAGPGSSPTRRRTQRSSPRPSLTRWTARSATRSTSAASRRSARRTWFPAFWRPCTTRGNGAGTGASCMSSPGSESYVPKRLVRDADDGAAGAWRRDGSRRPRRCRWRSWATSGSGRRRRKSPWSW